MGKHLVYIAGALAIIVIICSITAATTKGNSGSSNKSIVTDTINDIKIQEGNKATTNIWDYVKSQKDKDTIGSSSEGTAQTSAQESQAEPALTIVLK